MGQEEKEAIFFLICSQDVDVTANVDNYCPSLIAPEMCMKEGGVEELTFNHIACFQVTYAPDCQMKENVFGGIANQADFYDNVLVSVIIDDMCFCLKCLFI